MNKKNLLRGICTYLFNQLGRGHTECVYHKALIAELQACPLVQRVEFEKQVPITYTDSYNGHTYTVGSCRVDILYVDVVTEETVLVELKVATSNVGSGAYHQTAKYIRLLKDLDVRVDRAYLINFKQSCSDTEELEFVQVQ